MKLKNQARASLLLPVLTLLCCLCVGQTRAQSVPVTIRVAEAPLEQVLVAIEKQTSYLFVYEKSVDVGRKVSLDAVDMPLKSVLDRLFQSTDTSYAVENTSIVLSRPAADSPPRQPQQVAGVVVDASGQGIVGVAVIVKGTTVGTSTGADGSFSLQVPPPAAEAVLTVNYLGYETQDVVVGNRTDLRITLRESALNVDAVVVTALGIKRSEKALSYNVQKVAQQDIVTVKDVNFVNSLNGKVAGVTINASSSGVGGASKVIMRGTKGIDQSSNALYVIDGIPMYNMRGEGGTGYDSAGTSEPIADINPEDIESVTVLTGAAAAALYGSHASNGAIVVTTKTGQKNHTTVTLTSNTELLSPFVLPRFQNRYGTGNLSSQQAAPQLSWGHPLNEYNRRGYEPRDDYFQLGVVGTETVSLSTGTERNQTYASVGAVNSRGYVPNNNYERYNFSFRNTTSFLNDRMQLDVGGSYIKQRDRNMVNQGTYMNPLLGAYLFPRGDDWNDIRMFERFDPERKIYTQYWPLMEKFDYPVDNPYWVNHRILRENNRDRYMLNAGLTYKILDWLSVAGRIRIDNSTNDFTEKLYATTNLVNSENKEDAQNGYYGITTSKDKQTYGDALLSVNKTWDDWSLNANLGGSFSDMRMTSMQNAGPIRSDGLPNVFNIFQLDDTETKRIQKNWHEQTQSVFASVEVGYKDAYYLTLTGRNDWPSQLAGLQSVKSSFFYPSVGASVVLSELIPNMPKNLPYVKLRGSFASVGLPFARFLANPTYQWDNANKQWNQETFYPMYNLKPERTDSWEVGLTMRFLRHFALDVSYYDTKTYNQTFNPDISVSSGYSKLYVQTGSVQNRGVELKLDYGNTWNDFRWKTSYTLSSNRNRILELVDGYVHPETGAVITKDRLDIGGHGDARFILKPGGTLGDLYSTIDLKRDSDGRVYIDADGKLAVNPKAGDIKLGSVFPKANMAWRNEFSWKNLDFGFMISARLGGIVYSATQAQLDRYGVSEASAAARDAGGVTVEGNLIPAYNWFSVVGGNSGIPQYYTYSATNVRLSEASIGYTIPREKLGGVVDITLSIVGRNLWMIYNKAPFDPESVATTGNYYQGVDYYMMPNTRNVGFNVRLKF